MITANISIKGVKLSINQKKDNANRQFQGKKPNDWGTEAKIRSEGIAEKIKCQLLRDRSLFIVWVRGEGVEDFGDHFIFRRTKRGISRN